MIFLLLIVLAVSSLQADKWLGRDKAAHFCSSIFFTCYSYSMSRDVFATGETKSRNIGAGFTISLGLLKEGYDMQMPLNRWSWRDLAWDAAGVVCGMVMINNGLLE